MKTFWKISRRGRGSSVFWGTRKIGIGLGNVSYYDNSFMYADLAKHGNIVMTNFATYTTFDSLKNPTTDCYLVITSSKLKNGVYKLSFNGKCDSLGIGGGSINITNQVYDSVGNVTTADVNLTNEATDGNRWLNFAGSHVNNAAATNTGVTNIKLMRPGYTSQKFTSEFLTAMSNVKMIRAMDFTLTNSNDSVTWSDRPTPLMAGMHATRGGPWEDMIVLANTANVDLWINIPAKADNTYILNLARLVKFGSDGTNPYTSVQASPVYPPLNSNLRIYTEYGNEVWNSGGGFYCFGYALALANAYMGDITHPIAYDGVITDQYIAHRRWIAYRSSYIGLTFRSVFGDAAMGPTVRPMFSTQSANGNAYMQEGIFWAKGFYSSVRATAPLNPTIRTVPDLWYGTGGAAYLDSTANSPVDSSAASINAWFAGVPVPEFAESIRIDMIWAKAWGLKLIAYEGGPEPGGSYLGSSSSPAAVTAAINTDARMTGVIQYSQSVWESYGGDEFMYYVYSGLGNSWSFTNNAVTPVVSDTTTPKMLGLSSILVAPRNAATFGLGNSGTFNLKNSTNRVMGSDAATWYQAGACYLVNSPNAYLYVVVLSSVAKSINIALGLMNTSAEGLTIYLNGISVGIITPVAESNDIVRTTASVVGNFAVGVNVISIRKTGTNGSFVRDVVLS